MMLESQLIYILDFFIHVFFVKEEFLHERKTQQKNNIKLPHPPLLISHICTHFPHLYPFHPPVQLSPTYIPFTRSYTNSKNTMYNNNVTDNTIQCIQIKVIKITIDKINLNTIKKILPYKTNYSIITQITTRL